MVYAGQGRNGVPQDCSIRFDPRSPEPNAMFSEDQSPVPSEIWSLEPRTDGTTVVWWVEKLGKGLTSTELATQVAIRLVKQYEAYGQAFGR